VKGIILAGGSGTRLHPLTKVVCKQLLPVYDKPMIYYPLSVLMLAKIKDILLITTPHDVESFKRILGDGSDWGISIKYAVQEKPNGIAEAFIIGEEFIGNDSCALILGDNILYKDGLKKTLDYAVTSTVDTGNATIFGYQVSDPERYGVIEIERDAAGETHKVLSIEEKPKNPKSNYAAIGLYFYGPGVANVAKDLKPSARGELEITDLNNVYLKNNKLSTVLLGRGAAWLDAGTPDSLLEAGQFVSIIEKRQGFKIADLDEIATVMNFV